MSFDEIRNTTISEEEISSKLKPIEEIIKEIRNKSITDLLADLFAEIEAEGVRVEKIRTCDEILRNHFYPLNATHNFDKNVGGSWSLWGAKVEFDDKYNNQPNSVDKINGVVYLTDNKRIKEKENYQPTNQEIQKCRDDERSVIIEKIIGKRMIDWIREEMKKINDRGIKIKEILSTASEYALARKYLRDIMEINMHVLLLQPGQMCTLFDIPWNVKRNVDAPYRENCEYCKKAMESLEEEGILKLTRCPHKNGDEIKNTCPYYLENVIEEKC